jgi:hypothetical protein
MDTLRYLGIYGLIMLSTVITVSVTIPHFAACGGVLIIITLLMVRYYLPAATALKKQKAETAGESYAACGLRLCWAPGPGQSWADICFAVAVVACMHGMQPVPLVQCSTLCSPFISLLAHSLGFPAACQSLGFGSGMRCLVGALTDCQ